MKVEYVDHMGSDLSVVNAARVSFSKRVSVLSARDDRLLNYLAKHKHWSPFAHTSISLRIEAPIFVARQLAKHQVGLSWNEVSRRYVDYVPKMYVPDEWRGKPTDKKQGSSGVVELQDHYLFLNPGALMKEAVNTYNELIEQGVCPEQARMVLPQAMYTEWIWTGSLMAFARVCELRCASDTQYETRLIAQSIDTICEEYFPRSWWLETDYQT
jgi:thymidylate synthase, flavin-dependent